MVVEVEDSVVVEVEDSVVVEEVVEALEKDSLEEARGDLQRSATTMAITEDKKRVKMCMMKKSVIAKKAQSYFISLRLCFGAAALSTVYPCVQSAVVVAVVAIVISGHGSSAASRRRKLHKLRKQMKQKPKVKLKNQIKKEPKVK